MRRLEPGTKPMIFAYFFPPTLTSIPDVSEVAPLTAEDAIYGAVTGDRALREGRWKCIGIPEWSKPDLWPFPAFCTPRKNGEFDCMRSSEDDLLTPIERFTCIVSQGPMCIDSGVPDLGFVETRVRDRLRKYAS